MILISEYWLQFLKRMSKQAIGTELQHLTYQILSIIFYQS